MALKNIMRVDNGNIVGADTEARNFINNNLITSVNGTDVEFKFIYDSTQDKFGYRDASGTFVPFESGGDFSQLIYENLAAANIKKGTTISVKDPDGNLLNGATGSYEVNTFTNLTAANIKNGTTVTIKDSTGTTLKSVTGTYAEKPTLLWTNSSPNSNFSAKTISYNRSTYKTIAIKFKGGTSSSSGSVNTIFYAIAGESFTGSQAIGCDVNGLYRRSGCYVNTNGFYVATAINPYGTAYNNYIIPLQMYGYKTDLLST